MTRGGGRVLQVWITTRIGIGGEAVDAKPDMMEAEVVSRVVYACRYAGFDGSR